MSWLFVVAYALSGLAGLIYEVSWTRLLTLYIGHTTAAASAVVAAFLGGLAAGAGVGGAVAVRQPPRRALVAYVGLEIFVAIVAIAMPFALEGMTPLLRWAYRDGESHLLFPLVRVVVSLILVFVPALALGATFPMGVRWLTRRAVDPARASGLLYTVNTVGAAAGAVLAGFYLIPSLGVSGTSRIGVAVSAVAAATAGVALFRERAEEAPNAPFAASRPPRHEPRRARSTNSGTAVDAAPDRRWLIALVLGISGFASLTHEIIWTRILALVLGPTVYAFSATLAAVIGGVAVGAAIGVWMAARTRAPGAWLAIILLAGAVTVSVTSALAGGTIPRLVAAQLAGTENLFAQLQSQGAQLTVALIVPTSLCMGALFPLAFALVAHGADSAARRFGFVYAINTLGAVAGSLLAGFVIIPRLGLQAGLAVVSSCLVTAALIVIVRGGLTPVARMAMVTVGALVAVGLSFTPPWDRALLSSGVYLYAPDVPAGVNREALLKAGSLLYYREGAAATVSVKKLTGTTTLAVDGKVDASNRRDMLTQKLIAHLPIALHGNAKTVGIVGLGSGVTAGAALQHPVERVDVIEISPEVVAASEYFRAENRDALADPRLRVIVGDGRSHLMLSDRRYDVVVSEPSNPWIAGVAALFTKEFFTAVKARLEPGGVVCQWAHTYNISDADLRSIVATFRSVFPNGTAWMVGGDDVMLIASADRLDARLANVAKAWAHPQVAADLASVNVIDPFSIYSLYAAGPEELTAYAANAAILSDDRMALEFSAPRELHQPDAQDNSAAILALLDPERAPAVIREARLSASAASWRNRGGMLAKSDVYGFAYDDYVKALQMDPGDQAALDGLVQTAVLMRRATDALSWLTGITVNTTPSVPVLIARSKLLAAGGSSTAALETATEASSRTPIDPAALEQLASLHADAGNVAGLEATVERLNTLAPGRAGTHYFASVAAFVRGRHEDALAAAERALAIDPKYAAAYDLLGAAYTKTGQIDKARQAFESSIALNAHDSTAYTNLGLLAQAAGSNAAAANFFAEALWLAPESPAARQGLAQTAQ